jgi:hypothetical protein
MADFIGLGVLRHLQGMRALRAQVHPSSTVNPVSH